MAELTPSFGAHAWPQDGTESPPQGTPSQPGVGLPLRQTNASSSAQGDALMSFPRTDQVPYEDLLCEAHAVIVRDGNAFSLPDKDEDSTPLKYIRGDRVRVSDELEPGRRIDETRKLIPVINVETDVTFEIAYDYLCFVPQLRTNVRAQNAVCVSPEHTIECGSVTTVACLYAQWLPAKPEQVVFIWLSKNKTAPGRQERNSLHQWIGKENTAEAFHEQWRLVTKYVADRGLLMGDSDVQPPRVSIESLDDAEGDDLALRWGKALLLYGKTSCNLSPCPAFGSPDVDLVASLIGGYNFTEHYHVQDNDTHECPLGAAHEKHCILRDNGTRCAYVTDRVRHTCCRLRVNPVLPGPHADPHDQTVPLWETTTGDEHFVDVSSRVYTRTGLEARDGVPPQLQHALQQIQAGQTAVALDHMDVDVDMDDAQHGASRPA